MKCEKNGWSIVYERARNKDGSLFFPERLTDAFLQQAHRTMGSFVYANQYQNEIIPEDDLILKPSWIRYFDSVPEPVTTFAFIDPAIGESKTSDYTALVIVSIDLEGTWYLRLAQRARLNPSETVKLCFEVASRYKPNVIGIEEVAYQKALLYMINDEMKRRGQIIPVHGVHPGTTQTKEMRIFGLVPRFEWSRIYVARGQNDFDLEYRQFPRGSHDDILDALSQIETIAYSPHPGRKRNEKPNPHSPEYESWIRRRMVERSEGRDPGDFEDPSQY